MAENLTEVALSNTGEELICSRAGFLPVPLRHIPPQSLADLQVYLANNGTYSLYRAVDIHFTSRDAQRLLAGGVDYVYVSVRDHQAYYRTIEENITKIVRDPDIQQEKRAEILYSTSLELANQLLHKPPQQEEIYRTQNIAHATVELVMSDSGAFANLFEVSNHDFYTATHMVNVCTTCLSVAHQIGLCDKDVLPDLGTGALLHDIGKIFIPGDLLNTPERLTDEQFELLRSHVLRGREHLQKVADLSPEAIAVVSEHHERMDGSGYPRGLKGDEISVLGRLAAIADTFEAMTSVRPYRQNTFSVKEVLEYLESESPKKYDRDIFIAFARLIEDTIQLDAGPQTDNAPPRPLDADDERNRRRHHRYYFRMGMILRRVNRSGNKLLFTEPEKVIVHNISCSGLALLSPRPLALQQNICISTPSCDSAAPHHLVAVVVRCMDHGDGWHTVGAQFYQEQSAQIIDSIKQRTAISKEQHCGA